MRRRSGLALGLLLGTALDAAIADPRRGHPVAGFGRAASLMENKVWADSRTRGAVFTVSCVGAAVLAGAVLQRLARRSPAIGVTVTALSAWTVLGGTSLVAEASAAAAAVTSGDLAAARRRLPALCGRDPGGLSEPELVRATVESVAENTCDAVVAPLCWGAVCGLPGLLGYRAVNTLDAMIGHRSPRYERFGWAAARLDDAANLVPARLTALLTAVLAPAVSGSARRALRTVLRDSGAHPSPNAGRCEAAFAGALDVRLGGVNRYQGQVERRGTLGDGPPPAARDIGRATRLCRLVTGTTAALAAAWAAGGVR